MAIHLSPRERQTVRLLSLGCTSGEAARILRIAMRTAENLRGYAMARLGISRAALLTRAAIMEGISPLNDQLTALEQRRSGRKNDGWNFPAPAKRRAAGETHRPSMYDGRRSNVGQDGGNRGRPGGEATVDSGPRSDAIVSITLTPREREVVRLVSLGCTIKEAARALKIPARNALYYKTRAMRKFGVDSLMLLTRLAIREGVSSLDDKLTALEKRRSGQRDHGRKQPKGAARPAGGRTHRRLDLRCRAELSPRERQVARFLSLGCTVREAAAALKLSPSTVDNYRLRVMTRLRVNKAALLTRIAIKEGMSPLSDKLTALEKRRCGRRNDGWN